MTWHSDIAKQVSDGAVINDSKTPSGVAHVGSLRGVLIHDAIRRTASASGTRVKFVYGCDDMDPVDELPHGTGDYFREHLGKPLCNAPAPPGMSGTNMADAYFSEFTATFGVLGIDTEFYTVSALYRSGALDETIDTYLRSAETVRKIYREQTGAIRPPEWLPFQPICERCGKIGTTFAWDYDGDSVAYECRPGLVAWAESCGHRGRVSPFGGNGKLPWKLEWAAKWKVLPVALEGAGKDHMGAHGSHGVAAALARQVLDIEVPVPFTYEFFTVGGAKMSSSKGIGISASELVAMLPPEMLRFLVLRVRPRRHLDFQLDLAGLSNAFLEYERLWRTVAGGDAHANQGELFTLSQVGRDQPPPEPPSYSTPFDALVSIVQQPHLDLESYVEGLGIAPLTGADRRWLSVKRSAAVAWSQRFSEAASRLRVSDDPAAEAEARRLSNGQRSFLYVAGSLLGDIDDWTAKRIQAALFDAARIVGLPQADAFEALYRVFFGWPEGPRAGSFLEFFGRERTGSRLAEMRYSYRELLHATAVSRDAWEEALVSAHSGDESLAILPIWIAATVEDPTSTEGLATQPGAAVGSLDDLAGEFVAGVGSLELFTTDTKNRTTATRTILEPAEEHPRNDSHPPEAFYAEAVSLVAGLLDTTQDEVPIRQSNPFGPPTDQAPTP